MNIRAVGDDKAVRRPRFQLRDFLALHGQPDRETGTDGAVDGLGGSGRAAARRSQCCGSDCTE
jgi:hypothetical protein